MMMIFVVLWVRNVNCRREKRCFGREWLLISPKRVQMVRPRPHMKVTLSVKQHLRCRCRCRCRFRCPYKCRDQMLVLALYIHAGGSFPRRPPWSGQWCNPPAWCETRTDRKKSETPIHANPLGVARAIVSAAAFEGPPIHAV